MKNSGHLAGIFLFYTQFAQLFLFLQKEAHLSIDKMMFCYGFYR